MMQPTPNRVDKPLSGTRPAGTRDNAEAARYIREMFSRIAPRYDLVNHVLSFSQDLRWRRRVALRFAHILQRPGSRAVDVCCGTGDLTLALLRVARSAKKCDGAQIFGTDFAPSMLEIARAKARRARYPVEFFTADALSLPFENASLDLVTSAFGFRNLSDYRRGLDEWRRVLRPSGELGILEFTEPRSGFFAPLARIYLKNVLPWVGGAISGSTDAYSYLPGSIAKFPGPEELALWIEQAGFSDVSSVIWGFGAIALHIALRQ